LENETWFGYKESNEAVSKYSINLHKEQTHLAKLFTLEIVIVSISFIDAFSYLFGEYVSGRLNFSRNFGSITASLFKLHQRYFMFLLPVDSTFYFLLAEEITWSDAYIDVQAERLVAWATCRISLGICPRGTADNSLLFSKRDSSFREKPN